MFARETNDGFALLGIIDPPTEHVEQGDDFTVDMRRQANSPVILFTVLDGEVPRLNDPTGVRGGGGRTVGTKPLPLYQVAGFRDWVLLVLRAEVK